MRIKNVFLAALCAAALFLTGCGSGAVTYKDGVVSVESAEVALTFPEDWTVITGDGVYDALYEGVSDEYASVKELKAFFEEDGGRLLLNAQSPNGEAGVVMSQSEKGERGAYDVLRTVHDTTVFGFRAMDMFTESSFEEYDWGGVSGVMSVIRVSEKKGEPTLLEEREFCFERGELVFSLKIHITGGESVDSVQLTADSF